MIWKFSMKVLYKPLSVQIRLNVNGVIVEKQKITLPDWTKFITVSGNGEVTAFCEKPSKCNGWVSIGNQQMLKELVVADLEKKVPHWERYCYPVSSENIPGLDFCSIINVEF